MGNVQQVVDTGSYKENKGEQNKTKKDNRRE